MGQESGRILGRTDIQWSSRSEHARAYINASTRGHSIAQYSRQTITRPMNRVQRDSRQPASASRARPRVGDKTARHRQWEVYINPPQSERGTQPHSDPQHTSMLTTSISRERNGRSTSRDDVSQPTREGGM